MNSSLPCMGHSCMYQQIIILWISNINYVHLIPCVQESTVATVSPPTPGVAGRDTPTSSGSRISLLVILIVGAIILLMVVSGLAVVFFGRRKEG